MVWLKEENKKNSNLHIFIILDEIGHSEHLWIFVVVVMEHSIKKSLVETFPSIFFSNFLRVLFVWTVSLNKGLQNYLGVIKLFQKFIFVW